MSFFRFRFYLSSLVLLALLAGCASPPEINLTPSPDIPAETAQNNPTAPSDSSFTTATQPPSPQATETLAPTQAPTTVPPSPSWIAYIGADGNVWLADPQEGASQQLTQDAASRQPGETPSGLEISYRSPAWSSDGAQLAYVRETGTPVESGLQYRISLWVYDLASRAAWQLVEDEVITGFAWQPGVHRLTYGRPIPFEYFVKGSKDGIAGLWSVDVDSGQTTELVAPKNGRPLVNPQWSLDGRFVGFEEVMGMEGRGNFAFFDLAKQEYTAWDEVIGGYHWSPNGEWLAYDRQAYTPTGDERIWQRPRQGGQEQAISPDYNPGYAFAPLFSPQGDQLAYLADLSDPNQEGTPSYNLFVTTVPAGGDSGPLGTFEQTFGASWAPDGREIAISAGSYEEALVSVIRVADGSIRPLAPGKFPAWQPEADTGSTK